MESRLIVEVLEQYLDRQTPTVKLRIRLYMALRQAILDRTLPQGTRLPPTRSLAEDLKLGRNTVVRAYEQLLVEGYLHGRVGDGTYVSDVVDSASKPVTPKRLLLFINQAFICVAAPPMRSQASIVRLTPSPQW